MACTHLGTFDDFVKIKSNDEQIAKQIQQARQLLSKKASATPLCHRGARRGRGRSEGLNANDRAVQSQVEKWTGYTPEELGTQLLTLTDAQHNAQKCVLMHDPMRPYICFELSSKAAVKKSQAKMPADQQIFQEQADDSFKFCKAKRLDDDKFNKLF